MPVRADLIEVMANGVAQQLSNLPEREQYVLRERLGLSDGQPKTLKHLADELGVSKERIRQIESTAMMRLRRLQREQQP